METSWFFIIFVALILGFSYWDSWRDRAKIRAALSEGFKNLQFESVICDENILGKDLQIIKKYESFPNFINIGFGKWPGPYCNHWYAQSTQGNCYSAIAMVTLNGKKLKVEWTVKSIDKAAAKAIISAMQ